MEVRCLFEIPCVDDTQSLSAIGCGDRIAFSNGTSEEGFFGGEATRLGHRVIERGQNLFPNIHVSRLSKEA
jgi:hypothetical protein